MMLRVFRVAFEPVILDKLFSERLYCIRGGLKTGKTHGA